MQSLTRHAVASALLAQAVLGTAWWCWVWNDAQARAWFWPASTPPWLWQGLALSDGALFVGLGLAAGIACWRGSGASAALRWTLLGATGYAMLLCLGLSVATGQAWLGALAMAFSCLLCLAMAMHDLDAPPGTGAGGLIRAAAPRSRRAYLLLTSTQVAAVWGCFLGLLPVLIAQTEREHGLSTFSFTGQTWLGTLLFAAASTLGLCSGWVMAVQGQGTPLPSASARDLVIAGPYRHIRNPMALAGISQGVAVGIALGSYGVLAYSLLGALFWQVAVRGAEERWLLDRFGATYAAYQAAVPCWRFRLQPYQVLAVRV